MSNTDTEERRKLLKKFQSSIKIRQEYMDYDYLEKLSLEELRFLANFNLGYYQGSVPDEEPLINSKEAYNRNNEKNADISGKYRVYQPPDQQIIYQDQEDTVIEIIEKSTRLNKNK